MTIKAHMTGAAVLVRESAVNTTHDTDTIPARLKGQPE